MGNRQPGQRPVDAQPRSDITDEQYAEFYKADQPRQRSAAGLEPTTASKAAPSTRNCCTSRAKAPFDLWNRDKKAGLKLYVKRVFIMDDAEALMPTYLRFVKGVIDSADLPLNVSREMLQESRDVKAIREGCTKRVLSMLEDLANHEEGETKREAKGQVRKLLRRVRRRAQGRHGRRLCQPRAPGQAASALPRPQDDTVKACRWPTTRPA
jgi:HSP90 family molecular chaperone